MRKIPPFLLLDAFRGIAALWVVMVHSCLAFLATGDNGRFIRFPLYTVSLWGQLGVVMFFVISGYCIMGAAYGTLASGRTVGRYGFDRIRRIYPPYITASVLSLGFVFLTAVAQSHHLLPRSNQQIDHTAWNRPQFWLANLLLMQSQFGQPMLLFVAWSLCYEVMFYIFIGILLILARVPVNHPSETRGMIVFQTGIGGLTFVSLVWLITSPETCPFPMDRWYQFGIGALLFLAFASKPDRSVWNARWQLVLAGILIFLFAVCHSLSYGSNGLASNFILGHPSTRLQAVTCLIFTAILWVLRPLDDRLAHSSAIRPLMWLGTISYSLYLVHLLVLGFVDTGGRRLGFDHGWYWVTYLLQIAVSIVAGWIFYLGVERHFISSRQKHRVKMELTE